MYLEPLCAAGTGLIGPIGYIREAQDPASNEGSSPPYEGSPAANEGSHRRASPVGRGRLTRPRFQATLCLTKRLANTKQSLSH